MLIVITVKVTLIKIRPILLCFLKQCSGQHIAHRYRFNTMKLKPVIIAYF